VDEMVEWKTFRKNTLYYALVGIAIIVLAVVVIAKFFGINLLDPSSYTGLVGKVSYTGHQFIK
jgi:hypothetical protein